MAHFIPFLKSISREETTNVVMREVFRLHGLPDNIISDHGSQFVSKFWRHLLSLLKISRKVLSSSHHPQTNGKTTHINQTLEQYLCCLISHQQDDWIDILHFVEFSYNNSMHSCILLLRSRHSSHIVAIILDVFGLSLYVQYGDFRPYM